MLYIFTDVSMGGTFRFFKDLEKWMSLEPTFVSSCSELKKIHFKKNDILLYQKISEFYSDSAVTHVMSQIPSPRLLIVVHDYFFLGAEDQGTLVHTPSYTSMADSKKEVLRMAENVIFPSWYIYYYYTQFYSLDSFRMIPHIDNVSFQPLRIPQIYDKTIKLAIITPLNLYKGKYNYIYMFKHISNVSSNHKLEYHLFGTSIPISKNVKCYPPYREDDIYEKLGNMHGMLFLNHFPEMYSYALTKGINSGLPILYSNFGAIQERLEEWKDPRYFPTDPSNKEQFHIDIEKFSEFIIKNQGTGESIPLEFKTIIPEFYIKFFSKKKR